MFRYYLRSDAQRSEEHKLKKEKELEKEIAASEREDDGGFSMQVKIIFFLTLMKQENMYFLLLGGSDGWEKRPLLPPTPWTCYLLQASPQKTKSPGPVVQEFPLPIQEN